MKHFIFLIFTVLTISSSFSQGENKENTTTYFFIRHAEKERSIKGEKNPHLTSKGLLRAQNWAKTLKHIPFDAVYSTDYYRTKETALPITKNNQLELIIYEPRNLDINKFKVETEGRTTLIVGHSNTTPMLVNKLLGQEKYKQIDDSNNSNLYIVQIINTQVLDLLLVVD